MLDTPIQARPRQVEIIERFVTAIRDGDWATLEQVLAPGAITRWPQSGEQITGATSCIRVYQDYPGGPPTYRLDQVIGGGAVWVAELAAEYGTERWFIVSVCEFDGPRIVRITDWFAPALPAPAWRKDLVDQSGESNQPVR